MYHHLLTILKEITHGVSVLILGYGVLRALILLIVAELKDRQLVSKLTRRQLIRAYLGSYILLSLEFLIAADIIGTIADPSLQEIAILGAIVLIRTFISFFLEKEVEQATKNKEALAKSHEV